MISRGVKLWERYEKADDFWSWTSGYYLLSAYVHHIYRHKTTASCIKLATGKKPPKRTWSDCGGMISMAINGQIYYKTPPIDVLRQYSLGAKSTTCLASCLHWCLRSYIFGGVFKWRQVVRLSNGKNRSILSSSVIVPLNTPTYTCACAHKYPSFPRPTAFRVHIVSCNWAMHSSHEFNPIYQYWLTYINSDWIWRSRYK